MARTHVETAAGVVDKLKVILSSLFLVAGVVGFYVLVQQGPLVQWGALALGGILAILMFFLSSYGHDFWDYAKSSQNEVKKVVWPERKETVQTTLFVFAFVTILGIFMLLVDKGVGWILYDLILGWN